ncbi:MAG: glucosyl-3-phosphoglycerate synthase [Actinomycetota bacterium]
MTPAQRWIQTRSLHHGAYPPGRLAAERDSTISVCVPARNCASTITAIVESLVALKGAGVIDQVVVMDGASSDGTGDLAAAAGAEVHSDDDLLPDQGPVLGKGDAMWRSLTVLDGDVICFVDGDTTGFSDRFVCGLAGPLVCEKGIDFVKATFRRPFTVGDINVPDGGGRVSQLCARPLLAIFYPELAGIGQPLSGEIAARRDFLESIPFSTGYAVEIAMLIDTYRKIGLNRIAQVDFDERINVHQTLDALVPMAYAVLQVVTERLEREGRLVGVEPGDLLMGTTGGLTAHAINLVERPPLATLNVKPL